MNKGKEYVKNTAILMFGKFSTQIISILLIPLYTYKLATENYGYIDLIQTYISLLSPIILLQLDSAVFRYLIDIRDKKEEKSKVISSSFWCVIFILLVSICIFLLINIFIKIKYYKYIVFNMIAMVLNMYAMSIARGNGHNKNYAISSIISSCITLLINLILIIIFNFDAKSILIAATISNAVSFGYIFTKEKIKDHVSAKYFNKKILKDLLKYSIPMIPNVLSWWIVGLSDRTIIVNFIGVAANGIYSISCKFSNLLNSVFSIFNMSWQETASIHINDEDASTFFSNMIINIYNLFVIISCLIIGFLPVAFNIAIGENYMEAYQYIPILLIGNICSVLVGLFGGIYVAKKMTKKVATTTILSAIINIGINLLFVKKIGLYAACISTLISYFAMVIYRYYDINKIIKIKIYTKKSLIYLIGFLILLIPYYLKKEIISVIASLLLVVVYLMDNRKFVLGVLLNVIQRKNKN